MAYSTSQFIIKTSLFIIHPLPMTDNNNDFRDVLRHFASGVTLVTIQAPDEARAGLTVSAFVSISDDPPLIMVALNKKTHGHELLSRDGATFAVNLLAADQVELSNRFASKVDDRFGMGEWETEATGAPILTNSLAWLDCTIHAIHDGGTHSMFVGRVQASNIPRPDEAPLIYWNRNYQQLVNNE